MPDIIPFRIQIASIIGSVAFLVFIGRLIVRGKLREEYAIIWLICTAVLLVFSFWREGLHVVAEMLGVYYPPSLVFLGAIFAIIVFLVHLSIVASRLQQQLKDLAQELALLKNSQQQGSK
jgi:hypothetical protein